MTNYFDTLDWTNDETHAVWADLVGEHKADADRAIAEDIRLHANDIYPASVHTRAVALRECAAEVLFGNYERDGHGSDATTTPLASALCQAALARVNWTQIAERIPCELVETSSEDGYSVTVKFNGR